MLVTFSNLFLLEYFISSYLTIGSQNLPSTMCTDLKLFKYDVHMQREHRVMVLKECSNPNFAFISSLRPWESHLFKSQMPYQVSLSFLTHKLVMLLSAFQVIRRIKYDVQGTWYITGTQEVQTVILIIMVILNVPAPLPSPLSSLGRFKSDRMLFQKKSIKNKHVIIVAIGKTTEFIPYFKIIWILNIVTSIFKLKRKNLRN